MKYYAIAINMLLILLIIDESFGQNQTLIGMNGKPLETTIDPSIKGSPYLTEDWCDGSLILSAGQKVSNLKLRYNAYRDRVEYQMNTKVFFLDSKQVKSFVLINCEDNSKPAFLFETGQKTPSGGEKGQFFLVLFNENKKLVKSQKKTIAEEADAGFNSGTKEKRYALQERYFLVNDSGALIEIKLNKKSVMTLLDLKKDAYNKLIKENQINIKNEKGLVKLLSILN